MKSAAISVHSLNRTAHVGASIRAAKGIVGIKGPREGQSFSGQVATFTDSNTSPAAGPYSATINWFDDGGLTEEASVSGGGGKFSVSASGHVFKEAGNKMFSVSIHTGTHVLPAVGTFEVRDAIIHVSSGCNVAHLPLGRNEGPGWFLPDDTVMASFMDDNVYARSATIRPSSTRAMEAQAPEPSPFPISGWPPKKRLALTFTRLDA